jgi:hypothetical protein
MKKVVSIILCLLFFAALSSVTFAAERTVQLNVPGCAS